MRESCKYGSVRGAGSNPRPYRNPDALTHLADVLMEDIVDAGHEELLAEEAEEFRDWRKIVAKFDTILAEANALPAPRLTATPEGAAWNLADGLCEDILNTPHEALLREAAEDCGDYRVVTDEFEDIINRGFCVAVSPPQSNPALYLRFLPGIPLLKLFDWLKGPLQYRASWGALATLLIVAILTLGIDERPGPSSPDEPLVSLFPMEQARTTPHAARERNWHEGVVTATGVNAAATSHDDQPGPRQRNTNLSSDGEKRRLAAAQAPLVGVERYARAAAEPAAGAGALQAPAPQGGPSSFGAFQSGAQAIRAGDTKTSTSPLGYSAANCDSKAQWRLGRMYAEGDGVKQDHLRAFEFFRGVADAHAEEAPGTPQAQFVANAFVVLGNYYLEGIPDTAVKPDTELARETFAYAASYFGDPEAQYRLGRLYLDGHGGLKEPKLATRWLSLAANKGQHQAQAVLGDMLFKGEDVPRQAARGLMWLALACDGALPGEAWIADLYLAALMQATDEERAAALADLERWLKAQWVQAASRNPNKN